MSSNFQFEINDHYLTVRDEGVRTSLSGAVEGTRRIAEAAAKYEKKFVLVDYRKVRYDLSLTEAYNLVKVYENKVPEFNDIALAVVVNSQDWEIAKFWESISLKRGYSFKLFSRIENAESWILSEVKNGSMSS